MSEKFRQEPPNEKEELQECRKMLHAQIDDMNDLNVLKAIASFLFKHSFDRND